MTTHAPVAAFGPALDRGLEWMVRSQSDLGELTSVASPLDGSEPVWVPDTLKFITALGAVALDEIGDPRATLVVDRAVTFLRSERESCAQWRYWSQENPQYDFTPPDADDTACASLGVATRRDRTRSNVALLLANRDPEGRFYTWLVPRSFPLDPCRAWALRDEYRSAVKRRREELWSTTEAESDDVDGVVNTNVIRYLGPGRAPTDAVRWVRSIIEDGLEDDCDKWHRNRYTLYAAVADARLRGIEEFAPLAALVTGRIAERVDSHGSVGPPLDTALALLAVQGFEGPATLRAELARSLVERQMDDGSWERSIFYYGGPNEVFGWASEALGTAWSLQALERERRTLSGLSTAPGR